MNESAWDLLKKGSIWDLYEGINLGSRSTWDLYKRELYERINLGFKSTWDLYEQIGSTLDPCK